MTAAWMDRLRLPAMVVLTLAAVALALVVGYAVPHHPTLVVAGVALMLVGTVAVTQPMLLPLLAMPLVVVVARAGGGGVDLTVSDLMLGLAFWPAVIFAPRPFSEPMRQLLWLNLVYQALTLFTVIANPFSANVVEWFHAWLIVSGALIVGWAVGATGNARLGLTLFLLACLGLALPTIAQGLLQYATGNFAPVYPRWPYEMHKNFIGNLLCFAAILAYARPAWLGWKAKPASVAFWIFVGAILISQSRQAIVGLAVGLLVISFREHGERRRPVLALLGVVPLVALVSTLARDQIAEDNEFNSWFQRLDWYAESFQIWQSRPLTGYGLRYWTQEGAPAAYQPPNAFLEVMASTGLIGLLGFLLVMGGSLWVLWRVDPAFGTLGLALVLSRLVQGQFDLFWVSIAVTVPFLLTGVALGAASATARSVARSTDLPRAAVGV